MADHRIPITIADVVIDVASPLSASQLGIDPVLGPFLCEPAVSLGRVSLRWTESNDLRPRGRLVYDPGGVWRMYATESGHCAAIHYGDDSDERPVRGVLYANPGWDDLVLTERPTGSGWRSLLALGAGELVLRSAILSSGGLVFHAASLDDGGRGVLLIGHAGAGKSTQLGLWMREPGVVGMNDDRVAARATHDGVWCYGTPWGGTADIARNHTAPLRAMVLLEQAAETSIEPLAPATAAPLLLARTFLPYWDSSLMHLALTNLDSLLKAVPVYRLCCRPDAEAVAAVRSVL